jgi:pilus assembly protein CpaC
VLVVSPTEVIINGRSLGSTTLILWEQGGTPKLYSLEVTIDTPALERYIRETLRGERITVSASGNSVTLSGTTNDPIAGGSCRRNRESDRGSGPSSTT